MRRARGRYAGMPCPVSAAARRAVCTLALAHAPAAVADPADYVFVPYASVGARQIAWAAGRERERDGERETQQVLSVGWVPTARWYTSAYGAFASEDGAHYQLDEWSWINHLALTTPGAGPVDIGVRCEIAHPHDRGEGTAFACGPTLQYDSDEWQANVNPVLSRHVDAQAAQPTQLGYQWQVKGLWRQGLEFGAQGFGSVGAWNDWAPGGQQQHTLGPALFAKWPMADGHALSLDAALLLGVGQGAPRNVLRMRIQREF
jgi:hypothetical protein